MTIMLLWSKGQEYPAIVEFAPFQKIAKKRSKKKDSKSGTIEDGDESSHKKTQLTDFCHWSFANMIMLFIDTDYKKFLELYNGDEEKFTSTTETLLEEIEAKTKELVGKLIVDQQQILEFIFA